jgi:hypothetical protein
MPNVSAPPTHVRIRDILPFPYLITMSPIAFTATEDGSRCLAPGGRTKVRRAGSISGMTIQSLSCNAYCGAPVTVVEVMT